jgi:glycerol kinase
MPLLLALDQGTTSSRAIIFDPSGRALATAQKEFTQIFPQPGWVEHDPMEIWSSQVAVAAEAAAKVSNLGEHIAAAGITNQRETTLVWDRKTGAPVYNAIVWQDRRTASICGKLKSDGLEPLFRQKTGLLLDPYFSGTKLKWILDNVGGVRARAERGELAFGTVDTWLLWNLTQGRVHATDPSNASRTLLFNIRTCAWDADILELLGIPASLLPEVKPSSGVFGEVSHPMGLDNVPVAGIAGDQQSALFGQACYQPGLAKNTYGTGCFLLMNTGAQAIESKNNLLTTIAWQKDGQVDYALEGSVFIGGAVVQWLRDSLGVIRSSAEVEALASSVPDSGGVLFVPAFAGLGAPHWDPYARGAIVGLTRGSTAARPGFHRLPGRRSAGRHQRRFRRQPRRTPRRRRSLQQQPPPSNPGRPPPAPRRPRRADRNHRPRRGLARRTRRRRLQRHRRTSGHLARRRTFRTAHLTRPGRRRNG